MTLHQRYISIARKFGSKLAIADRTTGRELTYSRSLVASLYLAGEIRKFEDHMIGILLPTSAGCVLSTIGTLMAGKVPAMINYTGNAADNCEYAQRRCDFRTIITSRALLEKLNCRTVEGMEFVEDMLASFTTVAKLKALAQSKLPMSVLEQTITIGKPDDTAVILFTSGSEKDPKAVELSHRNIISNIESFSERFNLTGADSVLACLPFFHVFGLTTNLWNALYHGMTMYTYASPIEYRKICEIMRADKPSFFTGTPSFYWGYLRKSEPGDFKSLRVAMAGADKCPDALRKEFMEKHGIVLYEGYGCTETSPAISANYEGHNKPGSVGKPIKGVTVRIEHHETGEDCAPGETGRILVKGEGVMKGYFDDFEATALHIRNGWYDTGDMGLLDEDGFLWHVGRFKRFIKVGGEMVSLVKVEAVIDEMLPEGVECCVVEVPDSIKGSRIIAVVTRAVDSADINKKIAMKLPNIALPKQYIVIEEFPKMGSGKIDFRKTTDIAREIVQRDEHGKHHHRQ